MRRAATWVLAGVLALAGSIGVDSVAPHPLWAGSDAAGYEHQLSTSKDFRIRLQAALELGKLRAHRARAALERALTDESAAVRAAAAAALKSLADQKSLPALQRARGDSSEAVRNQVAAAIKAIDGASAATFVVALGKVDRDPSVAEKGVEPHLQRVARRRLSRLPEVRMKAGGSASETLPELLLDARISRLKVRRTASALEVSAKVDFVLQRMPGREIKGRLTGAATVHGDARAPTPGELQQLRLEAIEAAADSALENVGSVLRAAVE